MSEILYRRAVEWIALNDEPTWKHVEEIEFMISTLLVADLFNKEPRQVAADVVRARGADPGSYHG